MKSLIPLLAVACLLGACSKSEEKKVAAPGACSEEVINWRNELGASVKDLDNNESFAKWERAEKACAEYRNVIGASSCSAINESTNKSGQLNWSSVEKSCQIVDQETQRQRAQHNNPPSVKPSAPQTGKPIEPGLPAIDNQPTRPPAPQETVSNEKLSDLKAFEFTILDEKSAALISATDGKASAFFAFEGRLIAGQDASVKLAMGQVICLLYSTKDTTFHKGDVFTGSEGGHKALEGGFEVSLIIGTNEARQAVSSVSCLKKAAKATLGEAKSALKGIVTISKK